MSRLLAPPEDVSALNGRRLKKEMTRTPSGKAT
jgi:hypothetical protein